MGNPQHMRSILGRLSGLSRARLQIIPDDDYVIISGHDEEARGDYLRGKVTLTVAPGTLIKGVQLRLKKILRNSHHSDTTKREKTQLVHQWEPFLLKSNPDQSNLYSNTYEWAFELFISGSQTETFKGCRLCSLGYRLEASTLDAGKEVRTSTPVRIIRCPAASCYDLMDSVSSQGQWDTKAEYNVSIRHQAIPLGGLIPIDVQLATLGADVQITKARFQLQESHTVHKLGTGDKDAVYMERVVEQWPLEIDVSDRQKHTWQQCLHLPRIVGKCSPDFSIQGTSITHSLHLAATLVKDGIELDYDMSMPLTLFISPEFPISGWDMFLYGYDQMTKERLEALARGIGVPPKYCKGEDEIGFGVQSLPGTPPPAYTA